MLSLFYTEPILSHFEGDRNLHFFSKGIVTLTVTALLSQIVTVVGRETIERQTITNHAIPQ